jgi:antirestriction protein ArdC
MSADQLVSVLDDARSTAQNHKPSISREERAEQLRQIHEDLEAKVASLTTSDEWIAALNVAAKFHRYSANNVFWLMLQAERRGIPIGRVAGFRSWQKLGRQVRKGEKSLKVLAPARYKITDEGTHESRWIVKGFTVASVFDISQTEGEDLPEISPRLLVGDGTESAIVDQVRGLITARGFTFALGHVAGSANGYTDYRRRTVVVRDDVDPAQQAKTAIHELAHVILHAPDQVGSRGNRPRCEVEAESVAYVVMTHLGVVTEGYSLPYVAGWSGGDLKVVKATAETVITTAREVIEGIVGTATP